MFGHQGDQPDDSNQIPDQSIDGALSDAPVIGDANGSDQADQHDQADQGDKSQPQDDNGKWQHPGRPFGRALPSSQDDEMTGMPEPDVVPPAPATPTPAPAPTPSPAPSVMPAKSQPPTETTNFGHPASDVPEDLLAIKQQALTSLSPLVSQLDQPPEEKFRTLMMMIQASDDQTKIKDAYQAANAIEDEKLRAQALLDIVNEINYFTQTQADEQ